MRGKRATSGPITVWLVFLPRNLWVDEEDRAWIGLSRKSSVKFSLLLGSRYTDHFHHQIIYQLLKYYYLEEEEEEKEKEAKEEEEEEEEEKAEEEEEEEEEKAEEEEEEV
ncbi:hypothetical protein Pcinc_008241 [Petrolisthes cinctipes]|uniref:Uncharacterized protein n=1 Tax=Petrolisthes cinctipes TaxID=88211 RepID=A0AAE1G9L8_PETCI|nr:hypothetical protein Pcinc_008241 [Petrolisthes cinctipes]